MSNNFKVKNGIDAGGAITAPSFIIQGQQGNSEAATVDYVDNEISNIDLSTRVAKSGDTMTGPLVLSGNPTQNLHATTKDYVDTAIAGISVDPSGVRKQINTSTAGQTTFTITGGYTIGLIDVFLNGIKLLPTDYAATNGTTVIFNPGLDADVNVEFIVYTNTVNSAPSTIDRTFQTATSGQTTFTIPGGYRVGLIDVYMNGSRLQNGTEFTATSGTTVVLSNPASSGDELEFVNYVDFLTLAQNKSTVNKTIQTATAGQTTFTVSGGYTSGYLDVYMNGARLNSNEYTANNGTSVILNSAASLNDELEFVAIDFAGVEPITTFNGRSGAVTLLSSDITGAGGATASSVNLKADTTYVDTQLASKASTAYVDGKTVKGQVTTDTTSWVSSTGTGQFTYKKNIAITGITTADYPDIRFTVSSYTTASTAGISYVETYAGGITLYASAIPTASITFDYVIMKG